MIAVIFVIMKIGTLKFLKFDNGQLNNEFIEKYIYYLDFYSKIEFLKDFLELYSDELSEYK